MNSTKLRHVIVFGCGPTPYSEDLPVMAPGARTWQIVQTAAYALGKKSISSDPTPKITIYGLEASSRPDGRFTIEKHGCIIEYLPVTIDVVRAIECTKKTMIEAGGDCVIGCASVQPCASAARYASVNHLPLWVDVFGDPIAEIQSKFEIDKSNAEINNNQHYHVWRLFLTALLQGDYFSGLSERQRYSLLGQLGCIGRLNRYTAHVDLVHSIPYGIIPDDCPCAIQPEKASSTTVMWCGSFNTWMDENTFTQGFLSALKTEPKLKLMIVGGGISQYNDISYQSSLAAFSDAITSERIISYDWQSLKNTRELYKQCSAGLNVDRKTAEAVLGSRTRIVNFMSSGIPVISTVITELTEILNENGLLIPFEIGNPNKLSHALVEAARRNDLTSLGQKCREFVFAHFNAFELGKPLINWVGHPSFAPDKDKESDNALAPFWKNRFLS